MLVKQSLKSAKPDLGKHRLIRLTSHQAAIIDADDFNEIDSYYWIAGLSGNKYYAVRRIIKNGKSHYIYMHRQIMKTPDGQIVHHENGDTLDNRRANLTNMAVDQHKYIHGFR